jgi:ABC-type polysaccharide/polyol phosphate export permease
MKNNYTYIASGQRHRTSFFGTLQVMVIRTWGARELIWQLYNRDFINANKHSFLGFAWHLITPFIAAITWIFMNRVGLLVPGDLPVPYPVYVLMGLSFWGLFFMFFNMSAETISGGRGFIGQVSYPHEALMIKQCLQAFSLFLISLAFNLILITIMGYPPTWWVLLVPVLILPLFFLGAGVGLVFSVLAVTGDIQKAGAVLFNLMLYSLPILYAPKTEGMLSLINRYNPLTYLFVFIRDLVLLGDTTYLQPYLLVSAFSVLFFMVCLRVFYVSEMLVIERMT